MGHGRLAVLSAPRHTASVRPSEATEQSVCTMMVRRMCVLVEWMSASHLHTVTRSSRSVGCRVPRSIASMVMSAIVLRRWCYSVLLERATAAVRQRRLPHRHQHCHLLLSPPHRHPPAHQCLRHRRLPHRHPHLHPHSHQHSHPRCLPGTEIRRRRHVATTAPRSTPLLRPGEGQERSAS